MFSHVQRIKGLTQGHTARSGKAGIWIQISGEGDPSVGGEVEKYGGPSTGKTLAAWGSSWRASVFGGWHPYLQFQLHQKQHELQAKHNSYGTAQPPKTKTGHGLPGDIMYNIRALAWCCDSEYKDKEDREPHGRGKVAEDNSLQRVWERGDFAGLPGASTPGGSPFMPFGLWSLQYWECPVRGKRRGPWSPWSAAWGCACILHCPLAPRDWPQDTCDIAAFSRSKEARGVGTLPGR